MKPVVPPLPASPTSSTPRPAAAPVSHPCLRLRHQVSFRSKKSVQQHCESSDPKSEPSRSTILRQAPSRASSTPQGTSHRSSSSPRDCSEVSHQLSRYRPPAACSLSRHPVRPSSAPLIYRLSAD